MATTVSIKSAVRTQIITFAEPAFALLGHPTPLYAELLRKLGPFGADVSTLSLDVSSLEAAHVACQLPGATIRVRLTGIEVVFDSFFATKENDSLLDATWNAVHVADESLNIRAYDINRALWGAIEGGFAHFAGNHIRTIESGAVSSFPKRAAWDVKIGDTPGSLAIEESSRIPGDIFLRISTEYGGAFTPLEASATANKDAETAMASVGLIVS